MTYEEYQQREATLKAELEALKPAYLAEHGLAIGTPVKVNGEDGLITERDIYWPWWVHHLPDSLHL